LVNLEPIRFRKVVACGAILLNVLPVCGWKRDPSFFFFSGVFFFHAASREKTNKQPCGGGEMLR
jgi:hypothetical protein